MFKRDPVDALGQTLYVSISEWLRREGNLPRVLIHAEDLRLLAPYLDEGAVSLWGYELIETDAVEPGRPRVTFGSPARGLLPPSPDPLP